MKHIRITASPEPERLPPFLACLLDADEIAEARAVDWNRASAATTTHLYAVDGNAERFADAARASAGVDSVTVSAPEGPRSYALLSVRDEEVPMFGVIEETLARAGLVVRRPLVYRDGRIHGRVVGDPDALQAVLDGAPDELALRIDAVDRFPDARADPMAALSDRQREAVAAALRLGYYEQPRAATHEDIAAALDCAPTTASTHLQKAEAKLIRAVAGDGEAGV